jgi:hypothetical protein
MRRNFHGHRLFFLMEDAFDLVRIRREHLPPITPLKKKFEALVAEALNHLLSVTTHLSKCKPMQKSTRQTDILAAVQIAL